MSRITSTYDAWRCIYCTAAVGVRIEGERRDSMPNIMQGVLGGAATLVTMEREEAEALGWRQIRDLQRGEALTAEEVQRLAPGSTESLKRADRGALQVCPEHRHELRCRLEARQK